MKTPILASIISLTLAPMALAQGCVGDIVADGRVDGGDLGTLLANWGPVTSSSVSRACDLDGNGQVNGADLGLLLANWGTCPVPTWGTVIEAQPDPAVVTDASLRAAISAIGLPWRVRDRGTGIEMVLIPSGTFQMGCSASAAFPCDWWEGSPHAVTLTQPFYLSRTEVTQQQYLSVVGSNPSVFSGAAESSVLPVEHVSWMDAVSFAARTGMRLPSEAEWERAYRAGTTTAFHGFTGSEGGTNSDLALNDIAWVYPAAGSGTHPVGRKAPNGFGLFDMSGNVWEWVNDRFDPAYYGVSPAVDPPGPSSGSKRVLRGGCWDYDSRTARGSYRFALYPDDAGASNLGFRVARNP